MILDYYRIFYYVAQYKSFSKAADVMGNNQPNITILWAVRSISIYVYPISFVFLTRPL